MMMMMNRIGSSLKNFAVPFGCVVGLLVFLGQPAPAVGGGPLCRPPEAPQEPEVVAEPGLVELAICLDTSGSMSGLIEAAKQKLWAMVNDLALAEPTPRLRVALLTFGNDGHNPEDGWVAVQTPLTDDLDLVSQRLFAQTTNGGTEFVGRVLQSAGQLEWDPSDRTLKIVIVAGNESADQDQEVPFRDMCRKLIGNGIMINAIYCGSAADSIAPGWREVARLADGHFASIDQDHGTIVVETPFDEQLGALSTALNATYVPFGGGGAAGLANQSAQDANAAGLNSAAVASRAQTKAQGLYRCAWDLVDACVGGQVKIEDVASDQLPENMQAMTADQRRAYVDEMGSKRSGLQSEIQELSQKRDAFVRDEMKKRSLDDSNAFDNVIRRAIRAQATAKGFRFKETPKKPDAGKNEPASPPARTSTS